MSNGLYEGKRLGIELQRAYQEIWCHCLCSKVPFHSIFYCSVHSSMKTDCLTHKWLHKSCAAAFWSAYWEAGWNTIEGMVDGLQKGQTRLEKYILHNFQLFWEVCRSWKRRSLCKIVLALYNLLLQVLKSRISLRYFFRVNWCSFSKLGLPWVWFVYFYERQKL